ncbi:unnamed protein product [Brugia pahangi]|uniref:Lipocalin n=1 Tax=Brugia pahangi TaxID=6280 RepID=A0A0N4T8G0_BRUPA|nr:unnamed protein product [Brugia pahangi]
MTKLVVCLAFIIFCGNQGQNARRAAGGVGAKTVTDYKADKLWDDDLLMETTQVQESIMTDCDTMEDGRLFILEEKPLLLITNSVNLMKWN